MFVDLYGSKQFNIYTLDQFLNKIVLHFAKISSDWHYMVEHIVEIELHLHLLHGCGKPNSSIEKF